MRANVYVPQTHRHPNNKICPVSPWKPQKNFKGTVPSVFLLRSPIKLVSLNRNTVGPRLFAVFRRKNFGVKIRE